MMINLRNHLRALPYLATVGLIFIIVVLLVRNSEANVFFGIAFAATALPVLYLHIEYLLFSNADRLEFEGEKFFVVRKKQSVATGSISEIKSLSIYHSHNLESGLIQIPTEFYFFAKMQLGTGQAYIVTSLSQGKALLSMRNLKKVPVQTFITPFASIHTPLIIKRM